MKSTARLRSWPVSTRPSTAFAAGSTVAPRFALPRRIFQVASRLGDGVVWYVLMLPAAAVRRARRCARPHHGDHGHARASRCTSSSSASSCASGPFITHSSIALAGAPLDRYSFPSGHTLHAVSLHLAGVGALPRAGLGAGAAGRADRRLARGARSALSDRRAGWRSHRRHYWRSRTGPCALSAATTHARPVHLRRLLPARQRRFHLDPHLPPGSGDCGVETHAGRTGVRRRRRPADEAGHHARRRSARRAGRPGGPAHALGPAASARSSACRAGEFDLVHVHTPFIAHYAGVALRTPRGHSRASRPITPSSRNTCTTTCRSCRARIGRFLARALHALPVRRRAGADRALRSDARRAARRTASRRRSTCCPPGCLPIASAR